MRGFVQQKLKVFQARRGSSLQRTGRNRMHANALGAELIGQIAAHRLQRRLHRAHDIVVRHDAIGAEVAHREHRPAIGHQRRGEFRHANEGMARNVHRLGEALGRAVQDAALKIGLGREGDRMDQDVEPPPFRADLIEHRFQLSGNGDIHFPDDRRLELPRKRLDMPSRLLVQPRNGELGARRSKGLRASVGDRVVVGHADDQRLLSG